MWEWVCFQCAGVHGGVPVCEISWVCGQCAAVLGSECPCVRVTGMRADMGEKSVQV